MNAQHTPSRTRTPRWIERVQLWQSRLPKHLILITICLIWIVPTVGLLVTSFRPYQDVVESGWWTVLQPPKGSIAFTQSCSSCHGNDGRLIGGGVLANPRLIPKNK